MDEPGNGPGDEPGNGPGDEAGNGPGDEPGDGPGDEADSELYQATYLSISHTSAYSHISTGLLPTRSISTVHVLRNTNFRTTSC